MPASLLSPWEKAYRRLVHAQSAVTVVPMSKSCGAHLKTTAESACLLAVSRLAIIWTKEVVRPAGKPNSTGGTRVIVYIWGNLTSDNFTPRPGKDTIGGPGQQPGLSASDALPPRRKAQGIDTDQLKPPLKAIPDDLTQGGTPEHVAIAPVDDKGEVDRKQLESWAASRGTGQTHEFTQILLDAVVEPNTKRGTP